MMKFLKVIIIILCILILSQNVVLAENANVNLVVNGESFTPKLSPIIYEGRTLVPVDSLFDKLNISTYWDETEQTMYFYNKSRLLQMELNSHFVRVDMKRVEIDVPVMSFSDQIYVPLRFICENFNISVKWQDETNTILIIPPWYYDGKTPIIAPPSATVAQAQAWARKRGATETFINLAPLFWELSAESGVDPAVAYAQSAKETAFGRFTGVVDESFNNPCGLKIRQGGSDSDPNAHMRFSNWAEGIRAQFDHLALYAGAQGYPKTDTPDPRHFSSIYGKALTVEDLGGKWAPSPDYGKSIVRDYLIDLRSTFE